MKKLILLPAIGLFCMSLVFSQTGTDINDEKVWGTWTADNSPYKIFTWRQCDFPGPLPVYCRGNNQGNGIA